jgi:DNA polymerase elongation subunit (family B)
MKQFEASWRSDFDFYQRYFDTELDRSMVSKINLQHEWFEERSNGPYSYILDDNIRLEKKQGSAKQGREHYGFIGPMYRNIRDNYWNKENGFNNNPRIWYLDIETRVGTCSTGFPVPDKALEPISLFQFYDSKLNVMFVLGLRDWKHEQDYKFDYPVKYIKCNDEVHLIETFLNIFQKLDPLIVYAWNGSGFDYPYIYNRLKRLGIDTNRLSNHGRTYLKDPFSRDAKSTPKSTHKTHATRTIFLLNSDGHFFIDLMDVYMKFTFSPRPSYSLDTISQIELGENKVSHTEYAAFDDFYTGKYIIPTNPTEQQLNSKIYQHAIKHGVDDEVRELAHSEFVYYGIKDTYLIKKIDDKLNFTVLMCMIAEKMGVQIGDSLGTVKPWSQYISNRAMLNDQVMPRKKEHNHPQVVGGYVRDPNKGKHRWVLSADVNSMYPLLGMVGFNMSPETYIPKHKLPGDLRDIVLSYFNDQDESKRFDIPNEVMQKTTELLNQYNLSLGINGAVFDKSKLGMVPEMVQDIYDSRKQAKKTMFKYTQKAIQIKEILKARKNG